MVFLKKLPATVRFILFAYLGGMAVFSFCRILLFIINASAASNIPASVVLDSFIMGLRFDTVACGYILILPLAIFLLLSMFGSRPSWAYKFVFYYILVLFAVAFLISAADMPWFHHQLKRLSVSAMQWTDSPRIMMGIIFQDTFNYPYLALLLLLIVGYYFLLRRMKRITVDAGEPLPRRFPSIAIHVLACLVMLIGIRGRLAAKSPIRWGTAFVSEYNFTNQLGLNPVFSLLTSAVEQRKAKNARVDYMSEEQALDIIHQCYQTMGNDSGQSPLQREVVADGQPRNLNVVLVLMESMSSFNMAAFGNENKLTPVLDDLYRRSLSFKNFYSDGIHTHCGVYSSLFAMPSLLNRNHMKDFRQTQVNSGLARELSKRNYETIFFTTHDAQFDNMAGFLSANGFRTIMGEGQFKNSHPSNVLGIPDHELFGEVIDKLNGFHEGGNKFFAAILTGSNHGPYEVPAGINFTPHSSDIISKVIEYADWSIGKFLDECKSQPWFDSTLFLFMGDHGALVRGWDSYITYHRVPLIIYGPKLIEPRESEALGGQVDIFPTVMGLLNYSYTNNSFGIDLNREHRDMIYFSFDDEYGAFSIKDFYVYRKGNSSRFAIDPITNQCATVEPDSRSDSMLNFSRAVLQTQQWLLDRTN